MLVHLQKLLPPEAPTSGHAASGALKAGYFKAPGHGRRQPPSDGAGGSNAALVRPELPPQLMWALKQKPSEGGRSLLGNGAHLNLGSGEQFGLVLGGRTGPPTQHGLHAWMQPGGLRHSFSTGKDSSSPGRSSLSLGSKLPPLIVRRKEAGDGAAEGGPQERQSSGRGRSRQAGGTHKVWRPNPRQKKGLQGEGGHQEGRGPQKKQTQLAMAAAALGRSFSIAGNSCQQFAKLVMGPAGEAPAAALQAQANAGGSLAPAPDASADAVPGPAVPAAAAAAPDLARALWEAVEILTRQAAKCEEMKADRLAYALKHLLPQATGMGPAGPEAQEPPGEQAQAPNHVEIQAEHAAETPSPAPQPPESFDAEGEQLQLQRLVRTACFAAGKAGQLLKAASPHRSGPHEQAASQLSAQAAFLMREAAASVALGLQQLLPQSAAWAAERLSTENLGHLLQGLVQYMQYNRSPWEFSRLEQPLGLWLQYAIPALPVPEALRLAANYVRAVAPLPTPCQHLLLHPVEAWCKAELSNAWSTSAAPLVGSSAGQAAAADQLAAPSGLTTAPSMPPGAAQLNPASPPVPTRIAHVPTAHEEAGAGAEAEGTAAAVKGGSAAGINQAQRAHEEALGEALVDLLTMHYKSRMLSEPLLRLVVQLACEAAPRLPSESVYSLVHYATLSDDLRTHQELSTQLMLQVGGHCFCHAVHTIVRCWLPTARSMHVLVSVKASCSRTCRGARRMLTPIPHACTCRSPNVHLLWAKLMP